MHNTQLSQADLSDANFFEADLTLWKLQRVGESVDAFIYRQDCLEKRLHRPASVVSPLPLHQISLDVVARLGVMIRALIRLPGAAVVPAKHNFLRRLDMKRLLLGYA